MVDLAARVDGLVKRFGDFTAVNGISFDVRQGEIFGFLGPNGSGKTTTIRMMLGLLRPSEGEAEVLGVPVIEQPDKIRPNVGYMSQRFSLYNDLTVMQNLQFYGKVYGLRNQDLNDRIQEAVRMAGLEGHEQAKTKELAGGWRQRLALGAAILHHPQMVFLDEPTAGVDPLSRRAFWELLYNLVEEGVTVFVTTHYMDEAEHCHRLAFIQRGELIAYGSPSEIKETMMAGEVLELTPSDTVAAVEILRGLKQSGQLPLEEVSLHGSQVHVVVKKIEEIKGPIADRLSQSGIEVENMAVIEPTLEDVFIASMK